LNKNNQDILQIECRFNRYDKKIFKETFGNMLSKEINDIDSY